MIGTVGETKAEIQKTINISAPDELNYTDILAYSEPPSLISASDSGR